MTDAPATSAPTRTLHLDGAGVRLAADAVGDEQGPAVLLLHGGGQTRHAWGNAAQSLARSGHYCLAVDLRGHGDSDWSADGSYTVADHAADVRVLAARFHPAPVLVGASLGGLASLVAIGESDTEVASALVLVDVTPRIEQEGSERIRAFMMQGKDGFASLEDAADTVSAFLPDRPRPRDLSGLRKNLRQRDDGRWYWHWDPRFLEPQDGIDGRPGRVDHDRMAAAARRVHVPTLLVRGMTSDIVSDEGVKELQELIPHAELAEVAGAGHMVAGDRNDAFNAAVVDFVARHSS
jgi:pimeloyl-ACP methyl ester carboxylesterase